MAVPIIGGFLKTLLPYIPLKQFSVAIPVLDDKGSVFESCIEKYKLAVDLDEYWLYSETSQAFHD